MTCRRFCAKLGQSCVLAPPGLHLGGVLAVLGRNLGALGDVLGVSCALRSHMRFHMHFYMNFESSRVSGGGPAAKGGALRMRRSRALPDVNGVPDPSA